MPLASTRLDLRRRRVPVILQQERAECGLCCLMMIAGHFGKHPDQSVLRDRFLRSGHGTTVQELLAMAGALQLVARPVRLGISEVRTLQLPAIVHWRMNHFVVLVRARRNKFLVHDPALGKRTVSGPEFHECFTGVAIEVGRQRVFTVSDDRQKPRLTRFVTSFANLYRYLAVMCVLLLVSQILALVPSVATQILIDEVVSGQDRAWLYRALAGLAVVMLVTAVLDSLRGWISLYTGIRLAVDSTVCVIDHLFRLPVSFVQRRHLGDLVSKLDSLGPIRLALTDHGIAAVVQVAVMTTTLVIMYLYSPALTAVSVVGLAMSTFLVLLLLPRERALGERFLVHSASQNTSLMESLKSFETIASLAIRQARRLHWQNNFMRASEARVAQGKMAILRTALGGVINAAEQVAFLAIGIAGILEKEISLGVMFAFVVLRARFGAAAVVLLDLAQRFAMLKVHVRRLSDIALTSTVPDSPAGAVSRDVRGRVSAHQLKFGYEPAKPVIRGFSCNIVPGSNVVITGPSGCGKTTLLKILSGQLSPDGGQVLVDGICCSLWDRDVLRSQVAIVLQNDRIFNGTVAENISAFSPSPDLARVREAAIIAGIWEDIQALPMRLETYTGDSAPGLSGGQVQRLTMARALYRHPKILFLDEATSHLDIDTEKTILRNIARLNITIISVAHRPEAIAMAQQVISLRTT